MLRTVRTSSLVLASLLWHAMIRKHKAKLHTHTTSDHVNPLHDVPKASKKRGERGDSNHFPALLERSGDAAAQTDAAAQAP